MSEPVEGWTAPVYQSIAQPHLLGGISSTLMIALVTLSGISLFWWYPLVLLAGGIYGVALVGTRYDTDCFDILIEHWRHKRYYEG